MLDMRIRRILLTAVPAAAAVFAASVASPPHLTADPGVGGCVNAVGVSACTNVGINVPNLNAVANVVPRIPVPNINVPHINPGGFHGR
jgi:hypothetical protein